MRESLVIVGNGMAAARLVEEVSKRAPGRFDVRVIGEEPRHAYNRVLLSSVLAGELKAADIELKPAEWWGDHGVTVRHGCKATGVDLARRRIDLESGESVAFSKLVFATGSRAVRLPLTGAGLDGVHTFRDVADVEALARLGDEKKKVLVIGGGLLGLEAAHGLALRGAKVTLAHVTDRLMERQLDETGAELLKREVERKGVRILLNASATQIHGEKGVEFVEFRDGSTLRADAVVFAVGVRANAELARASGVTVNRGVIVDDCLRTSAECVYAIGECAEHRGQCYGLVEPAYEQARVLAAHLAGEGADYSGSVVATNLKVSGVRVFSAGDFMGGAQSQRIVCRDSRMGLYKKLVIEDDRLVGSILVGDASAALWHLELIRSGADIRLMREELAFGDASPQRKAA
jgi:nitrite reductase (NADH) large subunit